MGAGGEAGVGAVVQGVVWMTMNTHMKQSMVHDDHDVSDFLINFDPAL